MRSFSSLFTTSVNASHQKSSKQQVISLHLSDLRVPFCVVLACSKRNGWSGLHLFSYCNHIFIIDCQESYFFYRWFAVLFNCTEHQDLIIDRFLQVGTKYLAVDSAANFGTGRFPMMACCKKCQNLTCGGKGSERPYSSLLPSTVVTKIKKTLNKNLK